MLLERANPPGPRTSRTDPGVVVKVASERLETVAEARKEGAHRYAGGERLQPERVLIELEFEVAQHCGQRMNAQLCGVDAAKRRRDDGRRAEEDRKDERRRMRGGGVDDEDE